MITDCKMASAPDKRVIKFSLLELNVNSTGKERAEKQQMILFHRSIRKINLRAIMRNSGSDMGCFVMLQVLEFSGRCEDETEL